MSGRRCHFGSHAFVINPIVVITADAAAVVCLGLDLVGVGCSLQRRWCLPFDDVPVAVFLIWSRLALGVFSVLSINYVLAVVSIAFYTFCFQTTKATISSYNNVRNIRQTDSSPE